MPSRWVVAVLAVVLGACGRSSVCPDDGWDKGTSRFFWRHADGSGDSRLLSEAEYFDGQPAELRVAIYTDGTCVGRKEDLRIDARIIESTGDTYSAKVLSETSEFSDRWFKTEGTIELTPRTAGIHLLELTYQPGFRRELHTLPVFKRAPSPRTAVRTFDRQCTRLDVTTNGAWLCDWNIYRGDQVVSRMTGTAAMAGNVVWDVYWIDRGDPEAGRLTRYVDTGTGPLVATPSAPLRIPNEIPVGLFATGEELVLVTEHRVSRYVLNGQGGLAPSGSQPLEGFKAGVALRSGDTVFVGHRVIGKGIRFCAFKLSPAGVVPSASPCQTFDGDAYIAADARALWAGRYGKLSMLVPDGEQLKVASVIPLPHGYEARFGWGGQPWIADDKQGRQLVPRFNGDALFFEELVTPGLHLGGNARSRFWMAYVPYADHTSVFEP
ncbi:MAG TPA: hypothetical protein VK420_16665 [Longimicrobium sp.]|nr:hypothetical protein [Longimicrobium sp.]